MASSNCFDTWMGYRMLNVEVEGCRIPGTRDSPGRRYAGPALSSLRVKRALNLYDKFNFELPQPSFRRRRREGGAA